MNWINRLFTEIDELISVISIKLNTLYDYIGNLESLTTNNKTNLVSAINEINASSVDNFITTNTNQTGLIGNKNTSGTWTFSSSPIVPNATLNNHAINLGQLNSAINNVLNTPSSKTYVYNNDYLELTIEHYKTIFLGDNTEDTSIFIYTDESDALKDGATVIVICNNLQSVDLTFNNSNVIINRDYLQTINAGTPIKISESKSATFTWSEDLNAYTFISTSINYDY